MGDNIINIQTTPDVVIDIEKPVYTIELTGQGARGKGATISVGTTTTLPAGGSATVENVGTNADGIFDFAIPKGDQGIQGIQGIQGEQGDKGDKGDTGVTTILNATYTGLINSSNKSFVLNDNYDNVVVYLNGLKVNTEDYTYTVATKTLVFDDAPATGYTLEINGIYNKTATLVNTDAVAQIALSGKLSDGINDSNFPAVSSGTTAPTSTPAKIGDLYVDTTNKKMYISNGTSSSSDWIKQNGSYALSQVTIAGYNPADSNTYYFGNGNAIFTSVFTSATIIPKAGTITAVYLWFNQVAGSAETSTLYIRVNNTTDYLIRNNIVLNNTLVYVNNTSLNIPVRAGDTITFKLVTPVWATNPTAVNVQNSINIDL